MVGGVWKLMALNITLLLATFQQALQQAEHSIPHADALVPVLWTLIGGLALLITVMLRLWYRDFTDWKGTISKQLDELKTGQGRISSEIAGDRAGLDAAKEDLDRRLEAIENNCRFNHSRETVPAPHRKRRTKR